MNNKLFSIAFCCLISSFFFTACEKDQDLQEHLSEIEASQSSEVSSLDASNDKWTNKSFVSTDNNEYDPLSGVTVDGSTVFVDNNAKDDEITLKEVLDIIENTISDNSDETIEVNVNNVTDFGSEEESSINTDFGVSTVSNAETDGSSSPVIGKPQEEDYIDNVDVDYYNPSPTIEVSVSMVAPAPEVEIYKEDNISTSVEEVAVWEDKRLQEISGPLPCAEILPSALAHYQQLANQLCRPVHGCVFCLSKNGTGIYICIAATPGVICNQLEEF